MSVLFGDSRAKTRCCVQRENDALCILDGVLPIDQRTTTRGLDWWMIFLLSCGWCSVSFIPAQDKHGNIFLIKRKRKLLSLPWGNVLIINDD